MTSKVNGSSTSLNDQVTWCHVISKIQKGPKPVAATLGELGLHQAGVVLHGGGSGVDESVGA